MKKNKAFTVVEVLLTMSILGFIILMTITNTKRQAPDLDKAHYKKAYLVVEQAVSKMINDEELYPSLFLGFKYTSRAITDFGETIGDNPLAKFREAFIMTVDPIKDDIDCNCIGECGKCFMTDDGIVYGIPNTDFSKIGLAVNRFDYVGTHGFEEGATTLKISNEEFLPISVYTNWEKTEKKGTYEQDVMYIGVQYDGNMMVFYPESCTDTNKKQYCKAEKYLMSDTIKKDQ